MKLIFSSDLHGSESGYKRFSELLVSDKFDMGLLGGDLMGNRRKRLNSEDEIKKILHQSGKPILFIMGNFDGILGFNWTDTPLTRNINQKRVIIKEQSFVGYQYTNPFIGGEFERTEKQQSADMLDLCKLIDKDTILVTHGPAYGVLDRTHFGKSVGSRALMNLLSSVHPKFHLFGHIHESAGCEGCAVNGAYPKSHKFVSIDTDTEEVEFI